jgi:hypothetical protein
MSQGLPYERGMRARRARSTAGELTRKEVRAGALVGPKRLMSRRRGRNHESSVVHVRSTPSQLPLEQASGTIDHVKG